METATLDVLAELEEQRGGVYRRTVAEAASQKVLVEVDMAGWGLRHTAMQAARGRAQAELERLTGLVVMILESPPFDMPTGEAAEVAQADIDRVARTRARQP